MLEGRFDKKLICKTDICPFGELFYLSSFLILINIEDFHGPI